LGEYKLAALEEPVQALWHFRTARTVSEVSGLAEYDAAVALFYHGAYAQSAAAFRRLLAKARFENGVDRRRCALWLKHASACAGYHAERERLGITEPDHLDPLCAATSLAACLRSLRLPYDQSHVLPYLHYTGEGSSAQDVLDACRKLGLSGRAIRADETGLKLLPKPLVAYVEHDHFVALVRADATGVGYLCSDCGSWPGGRRDVTWAQWRKMDASLYVSALRKDSRDDRLLRDALSASAAPAKPVRLASTAPLETLRIGVLGQIASLSALLRGHAILTVASAAGVLCGSKVESQHCVSCLQACPMVGATGNAGHSGHGGVRMAAGPASGDPVNAATGEEEYAPEPDLTVYNPNGPGIVWSRIYNSLRGPNGNSLATSTYQADDFGPGWSQPFNIWVQDSGLHVNTQIPQGGSATVPSSGSAAPPSGLTWDIRLNGSTVGTSASPNGWSVSSSFGLSVSVPVAATSAMNYQVRYTSGFSVSGVFDVIAPGEVPQGTTIGRPVTGSDAPATGQTWDVLLNGTSVATSTHPAGWTVTIGFSGSTTLISVTPPLAAAATSTYKVRYYGFPYLFPQSSTFSVIQHRFNPGTGTKYLVEPNGSRIAFSASAVPSSSLTDVVCSPSPGVPMQMDWIYESGNPLGHYVVTFSGGNRWVTNNGLKSLGGTTVLYGLSQIADRLGNYLQLSYGSTLADSGFPPLTAVLDGSTGSTLLALTRATDGTANILAASDAYGRSVYYHTGNYPCANVPSGYVQSFQQVDQVSQVVATGTSSPPLRWTYGYQNVSNQEASETVPFLHTITVPSPTGSGTSTATINYDPATDFVSSLVDANGNTTSFTIVDGTHTGVTIQDPLGATVYSYTLGFDNGMNPTTVTDGSNVTVVNDQAYADAFNPHRATTVTDGNGNVTTYTYDAFGSVATVTSPRSVTTTITEDYTNWPYGRLVGGQTGSKTPVSLTYYEPSGLVQSMSTPRPGTTSGVVVTTYFTYDGLGNVLTVAAPGNNAAATITTTLDYQTDGVYTQAAAVGQPIAVTNNLGKTTHFRYDARGNRVLTADALGNQTQITYNLADQPLTVTVPATGQTGVGQGVTTFTYLYPGGPRTATKVYDESGSLVRQVDYSYGLEGELLAVTGSTEPVSYVYDAAYRLAQLKDGRNSATTYSYHTEGYPSQVQYPGGATLQYPSYDAAGHLLQRIDGRGWVTNYTYSDPESRLTAVQYPAATSLNVALGYDGYGRRSSMTDGTGSHSYTYDDRDALTAETTTYTGLPARSVSYTFHPNGSRATMTTPAGTFTSSYDALGRLTSLANPYSETSAWTYLDNNWLKTQTLGNGAETTYTYNALGQLTDLENRSSLGGPYLSTYTSLVHDGAGNRTNLTAALTAAPAYDGANVYSYDVKNQLLQEQSTRAGSYTHNFGYDAAGNATTFKGVTHAYNTNNQDTGDTYDNNGNPTTYQSVGMTYDPENRLTAVGTVVTAGYRGDGLRAWKQSAAGRTYFLYSGSRLIAEMDSLGNVTAVDTFGRAGLLSRRAGGTSVFYTFDPQGSVSERLDGTAAVLTSHVWDAHGVGQSTGVTTDPHGYKGQWGYYRDVETGLLLLTHRYYDPGMGRFLTRDPIGYRGGIALYGYASGNPVTHIDPQGLMDNITDLEGGGCAGGTHVDIEFGPTGGDGGGSGGVLLDPTSEPGHRFPVDCNTEAVDNYVEHWDEILEEGGGIYRVGNVDPEKFLPGELYADQPGRNFWYHQMCRVGNMVYDKFAFPETGVGTFQEAVDYYTNPNVTIHPWTDDAYWGANLRTPDGSYPWWWPSHGL
jgi:RHS repeat-associated protein